VEAEGLGIELGAIAATIGPSALAGRRRGRRRRGLSELERIVGAAVERRRRRDEGKAGGGQKGQRDGPKDGAERHQDLTEGKGLSASMIRAIGRQRAPARCEVM